MCTPVESVAQRAGTCLFSAIGASSWQPGATPQVFFIQKSTALKARFTAATWD